MYSYPFHHATDCNSQPDSHHNLVFILILWFGLNIVGHLADPLVQQSLIKAPRGETGWVLASQISLDDNTQGSRGTGPLLKAVWFY